ncbi:hypothetical protein CANCADRAFT_30040 [Tortispora caseinolytica NRRL Y-17796]|uniref:Kinesin-like protein n=1 Tax=Tortispora caseinolytica NRRL Y-17796 TaxID=767744 RepID=A0A1E4TIW0_9ASCO|nr:hypothetical protein CANCADRAFT_30040 [Tortispora caseinolytica NRRL Y-17796]
MAQIPPSQQSSITVTVRVRPFTQSETARLAPIPDQNVFLGDGSLASTSQALPIYGANRLRKLINVVDDRMLIFDPPETNPVVKMHKALLPSNVKRSREYKFVFDRLFDETATQDDVYQNTTRPLLDSVLDGYNATVFAYGATGCGKTHTISGTPDDPGVIFLTMKELFNRIEEQSADKVVELSLSYLEIYNETIKDLLDPSSKNLILREDENRKITVSNLSSHSPHCVEEVMEMILKGNENRTMSPTEANATSSRSHAVLQINIVQRDRTAALTEAHTFATLSIIDLAGSERASATKNRGERLLEGANINKSLLALGNCINALCDPKRHNHVPYRDSKLTRLLKFSLGGNCKTVMIVCVSPSSQHYDETLNTLKYADRAKKIKTKVTRNEHNLDRHVGSYLKMIAELRAEISELKEKSAQDNLALRKPLSKLEENWDRAFKAATAKLLSLHNDQMTTREQRVNQIKRQRQCKWQIMLLNHWISAAELLLNTPEFTPYIPEMSNAVSEAETLLGNLTSESEALASSIGTIAIGEKKFDDQVSSLTRKLQETDKCSPIYLSAFTAYAEKLKVVAEKQIAEGSVYEPATDSEGPIAYKDAITSLSSRLSSIVLNCTQNLSIEGEQVLRGLSEDLMGWYKNITSCVEKSEDELMTNSVAFRPIMPSADARLLSPSKKQHKTFGVRQLGKVVMPLSPSKTLKRSAVKAGVVISSPKARKKAAKQVRWRDEKLQECLSPAKTFPEDTTEFRKAKQETVLATQIDTAINSESSETHAKEKKSQEEVDMDSDIDELPEIPKLNFPNLVKMGSEDVEMVAEPAEIKPITETLLSVTKEFDPAKPVSHVNVTLGQDSNNIQRPLVRPIKRHSLSVDLRSTPLDKENAADITENRRVSSLGLPSRLMGHTAASALKQVGINRANADVKTTRPAPWR